MCMDSSHCLLGKEVSLRMEVLPAMVGKLPLPEASEKVF
jgi:hypothetical protein